MATVNQYKFLGTNIATDVEQSNINTRCGERRFS